MGSKKEVRERREQMAQIFDEVFQIAWSKSSDIMRAALEQYRIKYAQLLTGKKDGD